VTYGARILQFAVVGIVCLLISPNKASAIAYFIVLGSLSVIILLLLGIGAALIRWLTKVFRP
jgi:hypothetical protein